MLEKASESVFNCAAPTCWTRFALGKKWSNVSLRANQFGPGFWHTIIYSLEASVHGSVGDMREISALVRLRGIGVVVFAFAALALFAIPASAVAVPGTYTVTALVSSNGAPGTTVVECLRKGRGMGVGA